VLFTFHFFRAFSKVYRKHYFFSDLEKKPYFGNSFQKRQKK